MGLLKFFKKIEPNKEERPFLYTLYEGFFTFAFVPDTVTKGGVHIRDRIDLKRTMTFVIYGLILAFLFGTYNIGQQHFKALGQYPGHWEAFHLKFFYGLIKILPIYIVAMVVGLGIEFYFAYKKGAGIEEGFLVTGMLIPLIMPPDIPIWILVLAVAFAVVFGKEAFGGTGMNVVNVALLTRAFIFFAYPTTISGDSVWVAGLTDMAPGSGVDYGFWELSVFNPVFEAFGWAVFDPAATVVDGFTGATPLGLVGTGGWEAVQHVYSSSDMLWGWIPGSIGETSKVLVVLGAIFLLVTRIASWRIMLWAIVGATGMAFLFQAWGVIPAMQVPWYGHFLMGGMLFGIAFMATDPVTAASTNRGKMIYGLLIGVFGMLIRVVNPAYPEGWMLAILLLNVFAPLIDYYVIQGNIKRRLKRIASS